LYIGGCRWSKKSARIPVRVGAFSMSGRSVCVFVSLPTRLAGSGIWLSSRSILSPLPGEGGTGWVDGLRCRRLVLAPRMGCPLFDRPKRGRKKPHQPALAHCVRVAGLDALRRTALLCFGAANRKGSKGHPVDSLGHLRWPRSNSDSRREAGGHTLAVPLCSQRRPRRRTAKGPGQTLA
jgi:hypothetical protein